MKTLALECWFRDMVDRKIYFYSQNNDDFIMCGRLQESRIDSDKPFLIENDSFYIYFGYDDVVDYKSLNKELYLSLSNLPF